MTRSTRQAEAIAARSWVYAQPTADESSTDRFLRLACLNFTQDGPARRAEAARLLARHPQLPSTSLAVAAVCADVQQVERQLALDAGSATRTTGPHGWSPLMYTTYARGEVDPAASLATVRLLLQAGADPNDGRFFGGLPTPFTVLTGVFGGGETDQPAHPHAIAVARLLLDAGADPNDGQTLYNRMFDERDDFLGVLFEFGLGQGDGGPWRRLLPDVLDSPTILLRTLLSWAVMHDQRARVALLAQHGVDVERPFEAGFQKGATPMEVALRCGHRRLADQLRELGAAPSSLDPVDAFVAAVLAGDPTAVSATAPDVLEAARTRRPALVVWAAGQERLAAVELLVTAGFDVNALGRADVPIEQDWQSALHTAVERGNPDLVRLLLRLGADKTLRDKRFQATAEDWAGHLGHPDLLALLAT